MAELEPIDQNALAETQEGSQRNVASIDMRPKEDAFATLTDEASIEQVRGVQDANAIGVPIAQPGEAAAACEKEAPTTNRKPTRFYVDFENVRGAGLKGIDVLPAGDEVFVFYSQAAETFHIEQAIDILKSAARVEFVEVDAGTSNALDFQLITALFGTADPAFDYAIVSGDGGFDAAIKMGKRLGLPPVVRVANVQGDPPVNNGTKTKSRTRRSRAKSKAAAAETAESTANAPETENVNDAQNVPAVSADAEKSTPATGADADAGSATAPEVGAPGSRSAAGAVVGVSGSESASGHEAGSSDSESEPDADQSAAPYAGIKLGKPRRRSSRGSRGSGRSGKREKIASVLVENGLELDQQQLSMVMQALNGVKNKQQLYRNFVKLEGRDKGGVLYHQVKTHYDTLVDIVRQQ